MNPISTKDIGKLQDIKPRKKGVRRYRDKDPLAKFRYVENYNRGTGSTRNMGGKRMECKWCGRTYTPDGRTVFACNHHLDYAIHELQRRNREVPQLLWDLTEKIWMYEYELSTK